MAEAEAEFSFVVPQCEPESILKVPALDGITLKLPLPKNVLPGDELFMGRSAGGDWTIIKCVRTKAVAPQAVPQAAPAPCWRSEQEMYADCSSAEAVVVALDTTKGPILLNIVPSWAPLGVTRFLQLVDEGYFQGIAVYRGIQHGLLQFGLVQDSDPRSNRYAAIPDDQLVGVPYAEGVVSFAAAGPGTRKATVCIMKADFRTQLGKGAIGTPSTETPIGMVHPSSMAVMHSINCLGDIPQCGGQGPDPSKLQAMGNDYIFREFPTCDFVRSSRRAKVEPV